MLKVDALKHFGTMYRIGKSIGNIHCYRWGDVVPPLSALRIYVISNKKVPLRPEDYMSNEQHIGHPPTTEGYKHH